jgi:hypothetical protein
MHRFLTAVLVTLASTYALADSRQAQMNVSVNVVARTVLTLTATPTEVTVTAEDAARGYVVIPAALAFQVHSNSLGGYVLRFASLDPQFVRASVSWSSTEVVVSGGEGEIAQPYQRGIVPYSATIRLDLAPGTQPGTYAWPVRITAETV